MAIKSPFQRWVESEGVPVIRGCNVEDLLEVKVEPWKRKGGLELISSGSAAGDIHFCGAKEGSRFVSTEKNTAWSTLLRTGTINILT